MATSNNKSLTWTEPHELLNDYDYLVWDFDGTLVRLDVDWRFVRAKLANLLDLTKNTTVTELVVAARAKGVERAAFDVIAEHEIQGLEPMPDRLELLRVNESRSAILTNNVSLTLEHFFRTTKTCVPYIARDLVNLPKPDPEGIFRLRRFWQGKRTLFIGDTQVDQQVAAAAGIDCVIVCPGQDRQISGNP